MPRFGARRPGDPGHLARPVRHGRGRPRLLADRRRRGGDAAERRCMNVLGVHIGHDSAAAIVVDGRLVADVAEERFSRVKHDAAPPVEAIASCLEIAGLEMGQVDVLAVASVADVPALNDVFDLVGGPHEQRPGMKRVTEHAARLSGGRIRALPERPIHARRYPLTDRTELVKVEHHRAHAAAAYYTSGHQGKQLVVTMDGIGDGVSTALWRGEQGRLEPIEQFDASGSLGWFYGMGTEALGWRHGDGEGRTMGLAAHGEPERVAGALERFHPRFENGALVAPHDFGPVYTWMERGVPEWHLREASDVADIVGRLGREHVAAEAQRVLEAQVAEIVFPFLQREDTRALSCSGGVFLNVKLNQRIRATGLVDDFHVYPNPGDAGLAAGAALDAFHAAEPSAEIGVLADVYLGPEYSDLETDRLLAARRLDAARCEDVARFAADQLSQGKIVGWFQGRMESGP